MQVIYLSDRNITRDSKDVRRLARALNETAEGYEVRLFDNDACAGFLRRHVGEAAVQKFALLKGAHKSDLWRYALLYELGGVYFDTDSTPTTRLDELL